jgi:cell division septation protein DedD
VFVKLLFLILLLANTLLFVWSHWFESDPPPPAMQIAAPTLMLASELPPEPAPAAIGSDESRSGDDSSPAENGGLLSAAAQDSMSEPVGLPDQTDTGSAQTRGTADPIGDTRVADAAQISSQAEFSLTCASLGPFRAEDDASSAAARLAAEGFSPRQRSAEVVVGGGYWVHLPPYPTRAEAQRAVAQINEKGVPDAYIVRTGEDINAIALGLLTELARAERLADEVRAIGFDAQIAERTLSDTVFWVDVDVDDISRIDPANFQTSPDRIARLRVEGCPAPDTLQLN